MRRVLLALAALACMAAAQIPRPLQTQGPSLIAMAQCRSAECVRRAYSRLAQPGIIARLVYYTNLLRLQPKSRDAECGLLGSMPASRLAYSNFLYLSTYIAPNETQAQLDALSGNGWYFNEHLAAAMKLCPGHLADFIHYGETAFGDPHNDYANWAAKICRANPKRFLHAFWKLSPQDQCYFSHRVLDPHGCKQIDFPEGD